MNINSDVHAEVVRKLAEESVTPTVAGFDVIDVKIDPNAIVLNEYVNELYSNLENVVSMRGGNMGFSQDELQAYCATMVAIRVDYVNGNRPMFRPNDSVAVPSYLSVVLSNIGKVSHIDLGVELRPVINDDARPQMSPEEVMAISRKLMALGAYGFEYAKGFERSRDGSYDFMAMTVVKGMVLATSKDAHPVNALLASTVNTSGIELALSPRITYGSVEHFRSLVRHLAALKV